MKYKKWLISIPIVIVIFISTVTVVFLSGNQFTIARCIVTDNDSLYMVYEDRPIHLTYDKDINCQTGDKLFIVHQSTFAESDPEQTRVYLVVKISSGSKDDIPQKVFDALGRKKDDYGICYLEHCYCGFSGYRY